MPDLQYERVAEYEIVVLRFHHDQGLALVGVIAAAAGFAVAVAAAAGLDVAERNAAVTAFGSGFVHFADFEPGCNLLDVEPVDHLLLAVEVADRFGGSVVAGFPQGAIVVGR